LKERAKTKLVVGIQDLEAQVENFFFHRNQYFVWLDGYRCLFEDDFRSIINNIRLFFYILDGSSTLAD